jgi:DNA invertase Pin-like site-specific DNA recombinase
VLGASPATDATVVLVSTAGARVAVEVSSVPLMSGERVVGVDGLVDEHPNVGPAAPHPHLTPRQVEVLRLLQQGRSTKQIAAELHLSTETVRNHIRRLFRALGVNSRLEAVAAARAAASSKRPGLQRALAACRNGEVAGVVVKLDRLSRSLIDFAGLLEQARREGWNLVALDLRVDLSTPSGEFLASVMASAAQWERRIIGQPTKEALAVKGAGRTARPARLDPRQARQKDRPHARARHDVAGDLRSAEH